MLRLAEGFERDRRIAVAGAISNLYMAEESLRHFRNVLSNLKERRIELLKKGTDIVEISDNYLGELAAEAKIASGEIKVDGCQKMVDERREELAERMRERKTYERLRERARKQHDVETGREEIKIVDDIAGIAFARKRAGEKVGR